MRVCSNTSDSYCIYAQLVFHILILQVVGNNDGYFFFITFLHKKAFNKKSLDLSLANCFIFDKWQTQNKLKYHCRWKHTSIIGWEKKKLKGKIDISKNSKHEYLVISKSLKLKVCTVSYFTDIARFVWNALMMFVTIP